MHLPSPNILGKLDWVYNYLNSLDDILVHLAAITKYHKLGGL
jgi:hypothetical protein